MADNNSDQDNIWPVPKFRFSVDWGDQKDIPFQEVSGLDMENDIIEYRHGDSPVFSTVKMSNSRNLGGYVILKKGLFKSDNPFWDWYNQIKMNTIERQTLVIKLLDEQNNVTMAWSLKNAWPTKISATDLESNADEIAVDSVEIIHEGLSFENR
jgi:phage tail-like protein